jgi:hypothetical protein
MRTSGEQSSANHSAGITKRGYLVIIGALLVVIVLMASYILVSSGIFGPEYPNEDTPLELQPWGLTWTMEWNRTIFGQIGYNYSSMELRVLELYPSKIGGGGQGGSIAPESLARMNYTQFSAPATPELASGFSNGHMMVQGSRTEFVGFFISDDTDSAQFNKGDRICMFRVVYDSGSISHLGFSEDYLYQIGWMWSEGGWGAKEAYEFAVEDGKLYSWAHTPSPSIWDL